VGDLPDVQPAPHGRHGTGPSARSCVADGEAATLLAAQSNLGQALDKADEYVEAEVTLRDFLAIRRRVYGRTDPATRTTAGMLTGVLAGQGHHARAAAQHREVLAATPAKEHEDGNTLAAKANLASALSKMGDHAEAEALLRGAHATVERLHGPADARTLMAAVQLGIVLFRQGKHAEAEAVYRPMLAARRRVLGPEHPGTLAVADNLAICLAYQGQHAEAEELLQGVLAARSVGRSAVQEAARLAVEQEALEQAPAAIQEEQERVEVEVEALEQAKVAIQE
jgi:tetratricopeptide (TPR) repeat protein